MTKQEIKNRIEYLEKNIEKNKQEIEYFGKFEQILKILLNRIYGAFANQYSPFCDVDIASSITLTGQASIKEANNIINKHVKAKYDIDTDKEDLGKYGDTDSVFFTIDPILKKLNKSFYDESGKISKDVFSIEEEFSSVLNKGINDWALKSLNSLDPRLVFKREAICAAAIFIQKKRYILHILNNKGVECDKMKYVGVEVQRSNIPKNTKKFIKGVVESAIKTRDYKATNDLYFTAFEDFKNMPIEDIAFPQGIHNFQKYTSRSNALQTAKGTPVHAKASIYYNYLLEQNNLTSKYEKITGDAKIKWFYVKKNKYGIESVAFMNRYPKEFGFEVDYDKMFHKIVGSAVERLYETINWRIKNPNSQECVDLFEFFA